MVRVATFPQPTETIEKQGFMVRVVQLFMNVRQSVTCCCCNFFQEVWSKAIAGRNFPDFSRKSTAEIHGANFSYANVVSPNQLCFAVSVGVDPIFRNIKNFQNFEVFETQKIMDQFSNRQPKSYEKGFENSENLKFFDRACRVMVANFYIVPLMLTT